MTYSGMTQRRCKSCEARQRHLQHMYVQTHTHTLTLTTAATGCFELECVRRQQKAARCDSCITAEMVLFCAAVDSKCLIRILKTSLFDDTTCRVCEALLLNLSCELCRAITHNCSDQVVLPLTSTQLLLTLLCRSTTFAVDSFRHRRWVLTEFKV